MLAGGSKCGRKGSVRAYHHHHRRQAALKSGQCGGAQCYHCCFTADCDGYSLASRKSCSGPSNNRRTDGCGSYRCCRLPLANTATDRAAQAIILQGWLYSVLYRIAVTRAPTHFRVTSSMDIHDVRKQVRQRALYPLVGSR